LIQSLLHCGIDHQNFFSGVIIIQKQ
jgi:serine/threonine protein kinase